MIQIRLLHFDGGLESDHLTRLARIHCDAELVIVGTETWSDTTNGLGDYLVPETSLELARTATLATVDAVIIGNNKGTGRFKAVELPPELQDRTLIVWNWYADAHPHQYEALGITRFALRNEEHAVPPDSGFITTITFLHEIAALVRATA